MRNRKKLLAAMIETVKRENRNVYLAQNDNLRVSAAQRGMFALGVVVGLVGLDGYEFEQLEAELADKYGPWAMRPDGWFAPIGDDNCKRRAQEHEAEKVSD